MHKFYLDKAGMGLVYLLFSWTFIPLIIGFFEGLSLFSTSQEKFDELYNKEYSAPMKANMPDDLEKLFELKEKGIITNAEFNLQKSKLLK